MITKERLAHLQREAELGTLTTGGGRGISGTEALELIARYREDPEGHAAAAARFGRTPPAQLHDDTCANCEHASESHNAGRGKCYRCPAEARCMRFVERGREKRAPACVEAQLAGNQVRR